MSSWSCYWSFSTSGFCKNFLITSAKRVKIILKKQIKILIFKVGSIHFWKLQYCSTWIWYRSSGQPWVFGPCSFWKERTSVSWYSRRNWFSYYHDKWSWSCRMGCRRNRSWSCHAWWMYCNGFTRSYWFQAYWRATKNCHCHRFGLIMHQNAQRKGCCWQICLILWTWCSYT